MRRSRELLRGERLGKPLSFPDWCRVHQAKKSGLNQLQPQREHRNCLQRESDEHSIFASKNRSLFRKQPQQHRLWYTRRYTEWPPQGVRLTALVSWQDSQSSNPESRIRTQPGASQREKLMTSTDGVSTALKCDSFAV